MKIENEKCLSNLVKLLRESNRREDEVKERLDHVKKMYRNLYQEHMAYILGDLCDECQSRRDNTEKGGCITVCMECVEKKKTIAILRREIVEKDEQIRYWQDCYETALSERSEFPHVSLSQT